MTFLIILGLLGLIFGSFLNAYTDRYILGSSVWRGRSQCDHCKHELGARDLIPVLSFALSGGKCRYCGHRIPWQNPAVELGTAALFIGVGLFAGPLQQSLSYLIPLVIYLYLALVAMIVVIVDARIQIIPDRVILPAMVVVALLHLAQVYYGTIAVSDCWVILAAAFGSAAALYLVAVVAEKIFGKEAMGGGDIKLTFLIGLLVGWPAILVALLVAFWAGAIFGVGLLLFGGRKMADRIPFGPYLVLGGAVGLVWGTQAWRLFSGLS